MINTRCQCVWGPEAPALAVRGVVTMVSTLHTDTSTIKCVAGGEMETRPKVKSLMRIGLHNPVLRSVSLLPCSANVKAQGVTGHYLSIYKIR